MLTRRKILAALAAAPFAGLVLPKKRETTGDLLAEINRLLEQMKDGPQKDFGQWACRHVTPTRVDGMVIYSWDSNT